MLFGCSSRRRLIFRGIDHLALDRHRGHEIIDGMEHEHYEELRRLDIDAMIEAYQWISWNMPDDIGFRMDAYIGDGELAQQYPHDAVRLYERMAADPDISLRMLAAAGLPSIASLDPEAVARLAAQLAADPEELVSEQARRTIADMPPR